MIIKRENSNKFGETEDIKKLKNIPILICLYEMHASYNGNVIECCDFGIYKKKT